MPFSGWHQIQLPAAKVRVERQASLLSTRPFRTVFHQDGQYSAEDISSRPVLEIPVLEISGQQIFDSLVASQCALVWNHEVRLFQFCLRSVTHDGWCCQTHWSELIISRVAADWLMDSTSYHNVHDLIEEDKHETWHHMLVSIPVDLQNRSLSCHNN